MPLRIALIHDAVIPPLKYGGTERVVYYLALSLQRLGIAATVISQDGSKPTGVPWIPHTEDTTHSDFLRRFDLVHYMATPARLPDHPYLVTIHGNGKPGESFLPNTLFVSKKHAQLHGSAHYVHNGIDVSAFSSSRRRSGRWTFLAKASWSVKNLAGAIAVARAARIELDVLGSRSYLFDLQRTFPRFKGVRYIGMVTEAEKRFYLSQSEGLLFPVRWHEPFGLAVVEALASGCPVLATPYGAIPEIVTQGTGYLSLDGRDLVQKIQSDCAWKRDDCVVNARRFDNAVMAKNYLRYYRQILQTGSLGQIGETPAAAPESFRAQELLPWINPSPSMDFLRLDL